MRQYGYSHSLPNYSPVRSYAFTSGSKPLVDIETIASYPGHKILAMFGFRNYFSNRAGLEEVDSVEYGGKRCFLPLL
jgi:hypothetical protein